MSKGEARKSNILDFTVFVHAETEKAVRVSESGREEKGFWLPKSQVEIEHKSPGVAEISVPEWLAKTKGLI